MHSFFDSIPDKNATVIWTIYDQPDDFPHQFVARRFEASNGEWLPTGQVIVAASITAIRKHLYEYHVCGHVIPRKPDDNPHVVESWL
jgi:hypothetical protein